MIALKESGGPFIRHPHPNHAEVNAESGHSEVALAIPAQQIFFTVASDQGDILKGAIAPLFFSLVDYASAHSH
jgi:hypothetical protein